MLIKKIQFIFNFISIALLVFSSQINIEGITSKDGVFKKAEINDIYLLVRYLIKDLGANNDKSFVDYHLSSLGYNTTQATLEPKKMKGNSFLVSNKEENGYYFGRNYDSKQSSNLVLFNNQTNHKYFSSISTVNTDFIKQLNNSNSDAKLTDKELNLLSILAPMDGMNEFGVSISVNMNQKDQIIDQNKKGKMNITPTIMVRAVLDSANTADKAIDIIRTFNLHNTFGYNIHFNVADASGKSYVVEYIDNEMVVTEAAVVTNFCMAGNKCKKSKDGYKNYKIINKMIKKTPNMNVEEVKNTLAAAKNDNTQWSVIYDLKNKEAIYYFQENYDQEYRVKLGGPREIDSTKDDDKDFEIKEVKVTEDIQELIKDSLSASEFRGDDGVDKYLENKGYPNDEELLSFIIDHFKFNLTDISIKIDYNYACSAFSVQNEKGNGYFFGRNFDWPQCGCLILVNHPTTGYSSISTVSPDFIKVFLDDQKVVDVPDSIMKAISLYVPLDGMNEKGLSLSILNVPGKWKVHQSYEGKTFVSLNVALRILLNKATTVDEAIHYLEDFNLRINSDYNLSHLAISDASGKAVVVEYSEDQKMHIIETSVVANHYLSTEELMEFNRNGIINDLRYDVLLDRITKKPNQSLKDVRNTLRSVSKENTEWSIAFDKYNKIATYFRRRDYDTGYQIKLFEGKKYS